MAIPALGLAYADIDDAGDVLACEMYCAHHWGRPVVSPEATQRNDAVLWGTSKLMYEHLLAVEVPVPLAEMEVLFHDPAHLRCRIRDGLVRLTARGLLRRSVDATGAVCYAAVRRP